MLKKKWKLQNESETGKLSKMESQSKWQILTQFVHSWRMIAHLVFYFRLFFVNAKICDSSIVCCQIIQMILVYVLYSLL